MPEKVAALRKSAAMLAQDLRSGALDAVELTERALAAIEGSSDKAIFIEVLAPRARAEALAASKRLKAGRPLSPLDGIPVGWKDLFDVAGRVTTAGSVVLKSNPPAEKEAGLLAAAVRGGLVTLGVTNMNEFAYSGIGLNPHYGTPWNPCDPKVHRSPGGSSSGSAVAVAAGIVPLAIGTDTGGSIRVPAAFNGITGYKSSTGHYPMAGVFPLSPTLDTLGPLALTVEDCVLADAVLRGKPVPSAQRGAVETLRILVPETVVLDACEPAVIANFEASLERLARAGANIERVPMPQFSAILEVVGKHGHLLGAEALQIHKDRVRGTDAARMDHRVVKRIQMAEAMTALSLIEVQQTRARLIAETNLLVGDALIACPTAPHVAPIMAPLAASDDEFFRVNGKTLRNTMLGNFLDWCGVAMPNGFDAGGMPTSFLLQAPHGRDTAVLSAALSIESLMCPRA